MASIPPIEDYLLRGKESVSLLLKYRYRLLARIAELLVFFVIISLIYLFIIILACYSLLSSNEILLNLALLLVTISTSFSFCFILFLLVYAIQFKKEELNELTKFTEP